MIVEAKLFMVIDLSSAYHQVEVHPRSRSLTSFVTGFGAYRFCRMPFGLAPTAAVFQRVMQQSLKEVENVLCFQDDLLIYGDTEEKHIKVL